MHQPEDLRLFEGIDTCNSWLCVNSFAPWLSAIGTITISAIALWLSIKDRYIQMDASFDTGFTSDTGMLGGDPKVLDKFVYILSFTNIGRRPITVTNYEWELPFSGKKRRLITFPQMDRSVAHLCTKLPVELTDGKSGHLLHVESFFREMEKPEDFLYPKNIFLAWLKIHFFKMFISTSINKRVKVKINRRVRKLLWKEYRRVNV